MAQAENHQVLTAFLGKVRSDFQAAALRSGMQAIPKKETTLKYQTQGFFLFSPVISEVRNAVILNFLWIDGFLFSFSPFFLFPCHHTILLADKPSVVNVGFPEGSQGHALPESTELGGGGQGLRGPEEHFPGLSTIPRGEAGKKESKSRGNLA